MTTTENKVKYDYVYVNGHKIDFREEWHYDDLNGGGGAVPVTFVVTEIDGKLQLQQNDYECYSDMIVALEKRFSKEDENRDREIRMFGCTKEQVEEEWERLNEWNFTASPNSVIVSMLSDVQSLVEMDEKEKARHALNRLKHIILSIDVS